MLVHAQVHEMLRKRKKSNDGSCREYIYAMKEFAKQTRIDEKSCNIQSTSSYMGPKLLKLFEGEIIV